MEQLPTDILTLIAARDIVQGCALRMASTTLKKLIKAPSGDVSDIKRITIEHGSVELFAWLSRLFPTNVSDWQISRAALSGQLEMFKYLQSNLQCQDPTKEDPTKKDSDESSEEDCASLSTDAIWGGNLDIVKLVVKETCRYHLELAAEKGYRHILQYLHQLKPIRDSIVVLAAAKGGSVECLDYLIKEGYGVNRERTLNCAIKSGNLECVKYVQEQFKLPYSKAHMKLALSMKRATALIPYLHEIGCPWSKITAINLAKYNQLDLLAYAKDNGCVFPENIIQKVLGSANIKTINLLRQWGFTCPSNCIALAASNSLKLVKYLYEAGYALESRAMKRAIKSNDGKLCSYLQSHNCPMPDKDLLTLIYKHEAYECLEVLAPAINLPSNALLSYVQQQYIHKEIFERLHDRLYSTGAPKWHAKFISEQVCKIIFRGKRGKSTILLGSLHSKGYMFGPQCFRTLIMHDRVVEVDYLLSLGYTYESGLEIAIKQHKMSMVKVLLKYKYDWHPAMLQPVIGCDAEWFVYLISQGLSWDEDTVLTIIEQDRDTALMLLVQHGLVIDAELVDVIACSTAPKCCNYIVATYPEYAPTLTNIVEKRKTPVRKGPTRKVDADSD